MNRFQRFGLVVLPVLLSGCLVGSSNSTTVTGNEVSAGKFAAIKPGDIAASVEATLGPPSSKGPEENGLEVWTWSYKETKRSSGHVFLIFSGSDEKVYDRSAFVQFKDGVVVKAWRP